MASISSPGVGSNLDVKTIVSQLMEAERQPLKALDRKEASYQAKLSAYGSLKSSLATLQQAAQTLNLSTTFSNVKASVADTTILSAVAGSGAMAGSYNIEVQTLAQPQKLVSTGFTATDTAVGNGTLTISIGSYSDAASPPVSFTAKSGATPVSIAINSSNNTLAGIRDAINNANAGVSASIINDGTNYRLSVSSSETGTSNAIKIGVTESGAAGLAKLAYDASAGGVSNMTQNVAAKNAVIKVDGIEISKPTNSIKDAIQGITLNLTKETAVGVTTKLTLTRDTDGVKNAIQKFVDAYNAANKQIADSTAFNAATGKASVLTGDATTGSIATRLRNSLTSPVAGAQSGLTTLSDLGVGFHTDGTLKIDSEKLSKVLADPNKDVKKLFTKSSDGTIGYGSRINSMVSDLIFGKGAILNGRMDGLTDSIKSIDSQRIQQGLRFATIEKRYYAQFSALDTMISNMNRTSSYLTQQLKQIASMNAGD